MRLAHALSRICGPRVPTGRCLPLHRSTPLCAAATYPTLVMRSTGAHSGWHRAGPPPASMVY
eukprot:11186667-Alexandrium_andersonii.AAC.1